MIARGLSQLWDDYQLVRKFMPEWFEYYDMPQVGPSLDELKQWRERQAEENRQHDRRRGTG